MSARANTYRGSCVVCSASVEPERGYLDKREGKWRTVCRSRACCETYFGTDTIAAWSRRELYPDGLFSFPLTEDDQVLAGAISLWDKQAQAPRAIMDLGARDLLVEICDRLEIEIPQTVRGWSVPPPVARAVDLARSSGARPYQLPGVQFLALNPRCLLADEQGLGKTFQALHALPDGTGLLVVCPSIAKGVWAREAKRWRPDRFDSIEILEGRGSFRWPGPRELVILNYDILPPQASERKDPAKWGSPPKRPSSPTIIAADESHYLKNSKSLRHKRFKSLARKAAGSWGFTGTPIENEPFDLRGLLVALGCDPFGWHDFLEMFSMRHMEHGGYLPERDSSGCVIVKPGTTERLRRVMLRRTKREVLPELPPIIVSEHPVDLTPAIVAELDDIAREYRDALLADELPPFAAMAGVRKALAASRVKEAIELVKLHEDQGIPALVFSAHRKPIDEIGKREGWAAITGDTPHRERTRIEDAFQRGELLGVAGTIQAMGTAVTLTRATAEIFVDLDYTPAKNEQARARAHRIGQENPVSITIMTSDHVLDRHVGRLLWRKEQLADRTLCGRAEVQPGRLFT